MRSMQPCSHPDMCGMEDSASWSFSEHHQSHAASAFYPSPFDEAVVLTLVGVGEWATTTVAIGGAVVSGTGTTPMYLNKSYLL